MLVESLSAASTINPEAAAQTIIESIPFEARERAAAYAHVQYWFELSCRQAHSSLHTVGHGRKFDPNNLNANDINYHLQLVPF